MANGTITRKEIIEDEALRFGEEYAKEVKKAIDANKQFVVTLLELKAANDDLRNAPNAKAYNESLNKTNKLRERSVVVWKEQDQAERNLISTKRKNELATEGTNKALTKERLLLQETNAEIKKQIIANGALESAYKKLSAQVTIAGDRVKNIISTGRLATETQKQYNARLAIAQKEFDKLNVKVRSADAAVGQFNRNVGNYPKQAAEGLRNLISAFGLVTGISLFASVMKDAFNQVRDFEKEIVNLGAIAQKSRVEIAPLEAKIREVSKSSINGATDVAKLATELIKLGSTTEEAEQLLEPINNLSIALQASAEDSATLVKSLLNSYGVGAEEAAHFTDVLAESANRSALDFAGLRDSFSYLAPASRALGISVERTAAIIGTLADNGIRAESAGRLTSTAFARLAKQGLTLEDALQKINDAQEKGQSNLEVLALATELFGAESGKIGLILANNTEKIDASTEAYKNSDGALKELTNKQLNSLDSQLKILSSSWEDFILDTNEASGASAALSTGVAFVATNLKSIISILTIATGIWIAYRASILLANVQTRLLSLTTAQATVATQANTVVTGFGTTAQVANAGATTLATTAWQRFNVALKANVLGLIVAALVAVIYAFDAFNKSMKEMSNEVKESTDSFLKNRDEMSKSAQSTRTLTSRYEELQLKAKKLGGETKLTTDEQKEMQRIVSELSKVVPGAVTEVNKYGEALKLNTDLLKKFNIENAKILEIDKQKAIKDEINLQKELSQEIKNKTKNLKNFKEVEGQGSITTEFIVEKERELSVMKVDLILSQGRLKSITGVTEAEKEAIKVSEEKSKSIEGSSKRTIEIIDTEIKAQEDLVKTLSDKTGKEGRAIQSKIKALEAEREMIYSTSKAEKEKADNGLKGYKKTTDALFQLSQFRYQNEIQLNEKIIDSDKKTTEEKLESLYNISQIRESKNKEALEQALLNNALELEGLDKLSVKNLEKYKKDTENRIKQLLYSKESVKDITEAEILILEKYYADKKNLQDNDALEKQRLIDDEVARIGKSIEKQQLLGQKNIDEAIEAENKKLIAIQEQEGVSLKEREAAIIEHERKIASIKKSFTEDSLKEQIGALQKLLDENEKLPIQEQISADLRLKTEAELQAAKTALSQISVDRNAEDNEKKLLSDEEYKEKAIDIAYQLKDAIVNLTNAIFEAKVANIDNEIQKEQEQYDASIEAAGNDQRKKELLTAEFEKKRKALEAKKREEQRKQAIFNKVIALGEIAINTAAGIMKSISQLGLPFATPFIVATSVLGALQAAAVIATPLPKYKHGRKDGPDEFAIVGDGGRKEVVSDPDGSNPVVTPDRPTLTFLKRKQRVHRSIDAYNDYMRSSIMNNIGDEHRKMKDFQSNINVSNDNSELVDEMRLTRKAIERIKMPKPSNPKPQDINHELWKFKNTNW